MKRSLVAALLVTATACQAKPPSDAPAAAGQAAEAPGDAKVEAPRRGPSKVDGAKAKELVAAGAILLDVRSQGEWDSGHIDGAKLLPITALASKIDEVGPKDKPVVVYCASGVRSARAARLLHEAGWQEVYDMGGMRNWGG